MRRGAAWLAVVLLVAGCGGDDEGSEPATPETVQVVSQNLLHGVSCEADTDDCDLPGRVELFLRQLDEGGCPELVSLQEANGRTVELLDGPLGRDADGIFADAAAAAAREVLARTTIADVIAREAAEAGAAMYYI